VHRGEVSDLDFDVRNLDFTTIGWRGGHWAREDLRAVLPDRPGAEIFAERWTPLIIRNLHLGCETFGEILEGAPDALVVVHTRQSLVPELIEPGDEDRIRQAVDQAVALASEDGLRTDEAAP
jgi:hypothetical protein